MLTPFLVFFACLLGPTPVHARGHPPWAQYVKPEIATLCVGQACSMGSLLLCAGAEGKRASLPNSRVMVHQPSGGAQVRHTVPDQGTLQHPRILTCVRLCGCVVVWLCPLR